MINLALAVPTHPMDVGYLTAGIRVSKSLDTHTHRHTDTHTDTHTDAHTHTHTHTAKVHDLVPGCQQMAELPQI